jgi:acetyl esterase/lipase
MIFMAAQTALSRFVAERGAVITTDVAYGPDPRHRLDIYRPESARPARMTGSRPGPICVFYYGGAWRNGERAYYSFVGSALAARGITTVIPDYRLYPAVRYPAFIEDCALAYRHTLATIAEPGQPIIVAGHSAGAYNAAMIALDPSWLAGVATRPAGLILLAGPVAFQPTKWPSTADIFRTAPSADAPRPVTHVSAASPPALAIHGAADTLVMPWNQQQLVEAYRRAGRPIRALELPGLGHMDPLFVISRPLRWRGPVLDEMTAFLDAARDRRSAL